MCIEHKHIRERHVKKVKDMRTTRFTGCPGGMGSYVELLDDVFQNPDSIKFQYRDGRTGEEVVLYTKHYNQPVGTKWRDAYYRRTRPLFAVKMYVAERVDASLSEQRSPTVGPSFGK